MTVTANSLAHVMKKLQPGCDFYVADHISAPVQTVKDAGGNKQRMKINMTFHSMADFRPEAIVKSVPQLRPISCVA